MALSILLCGTLGVASAQSMPEAGNYDSGVRPGPAGEPTDVEIGVLILDLVAIDDVKQEFTVDLYITGRWQDPRLAVASGAGERVFPLAEVWHPAVGVLNRRDIDFLLPDQVRADAEGNVVYAQRILGQFASRLDLRRFPTDEQSLVVQLASYRYGPDEVAIEVSSERTGRLAEMSVAGWRVGDPALDPAPLAVPGGERSGATLRVTASRETAYYLLTMAMPLLLISFMAWMVFWIDPSLLPSQVGVATASVFSLIAFRLSLGAQLPKVSYLTTADWFILSITLLVFGALGETVFVGRLAKTDRLDLARRVDAVGRWVYLATVVLVCVLAVR